MNILRTAFDAMEAKYGSYNQKQFASRLQSIAAVFGFTGYTSSSVSTKLDDPELHNFSKYDEIRQVIGKLVEEESLPAAVLVGFGNPIQNPSLSGAWQHLMLQNTKEVPDQTSPSRNLRRALLIYSAAGFRIIGNSTMWDGQYREAKHHLYHRAIEVGAEEEVFAIYQPMFPRKKIGIPRFQIGACLGVAMGVHDTRFPVVAGRCVLRRLDGLSSELEERPELSDNIEALRKTYCGYEALEQAIAGSIPYDEFISAPENERSSREPQFYQKELIKMLEENPTAGEFGARIFVR